MQSLFLASDPEWLPSTIVQSSAALVAIVGGLLVARLVGIASDRAGLAKKRAELGDQLESVQSHHQELVARRAGWDLGDFVGSAAPLYYEDNITSADELARRIPHGASLEERREFAEIFLRWVAENEPKIHALYRGSVQARSVEDLRSGGLEVDPLFESAAEAVLQALTPHEAGPFGVTLPISTGSFFVDAAGRTVTLQRWDTLLRDIEVAERRIAELSQALALVEQQLGSMPPQGVTGTLIALAVIVAAGIAFPVVVMAMRWPDLTAPWRWAMVAAFLGSVAALGTYLHRLSRSLVSN